METQSMNDNEVKQLVDINTKFVTELSKLNTAISQINNNTDELNKYFMRNHGFRDEIIAIFKEIADRNDEMIDGLRNHISNEFKKYGWKAAGVMTFFMALLAGITEVLKHV